MREQSSLNRLLSAQGRPGFDDLLSEICQECPCEKICQEDRARCNAMVAILYMASKFSAQHEVFQANVKVFFDNLKDAADRLPQVAI